MDASKYIALLTSQHRDKPKFRKTVDVLINPLIDCLEFLNSLNDKFDLDTATGDQLQIIADWVGAPNSIPNAVPVPYFGFQGQPGSLTWRDTEYPNIKSGYWRESGMSGYTALKMSPQLFKKVIKAKILLNKSDCSEQSAKEIISLVIDKQFKFIDNLNMTITFTFLESYEVYERELVKLMFPVPSGVRLIFEGEDEY
ncbi:hypothetical protein F935_01519 [Acinetobacter calcoaceticus ANC 3811]|uniref:DUF2612 domain-containing protein n=1 Tax=Acinetobacter calcoaceticus ANC 3811 TaxID=1217690 RepID=R8Y3U6_ACICA|nr:DUF2612 domain-containing protein [Acinetobacter calcoaceticus]EOQ63889.1 hypothetical protein F935_01519 [Acinetobacter calcoaceticus ANC 3811]